MDHGLSIHYVDQEDDELDEMELSIGTRCYRKGKISHR